MLGKFGRLDVLLRDMPAMVAGNAELATRAAYDIEYGIYNHAAGERLPMAMVRMHPKEQVIEGGPVYRLIRDYHSFKIGKEFGISLLEYLDLPRHIVELLQGICKEESKVADRAAQQQMNELQQGLNGLKYS